MEIHLTIVILMLQILEEVKDADLVIKKLDLSSLESVRECAKDVNENESRLDILVNNAGILLHFAVTFRSNIKTLFCLLFYIYLKI